MQIQFHCPRCEQFVRKPIEPGEVELACANCDWSRPVAAEDLQVQRPERCLVCGCPDLWRQKDFPQRLGVAMVAIGAIAFCVAQAFFMPALGIGILLAFAAIDLLLYTYMPDVLVCYRCEAKYRHLEFGDTPYFQLETFERYRQEAARLEEAKKPV